MGLFGSIFHVLGKLVGGAAKAVASQATGGLSDELLSQIKSKGQSKLLAAAGMTDSPKARTIQTEAMINKRQPLTRYVNAGTFEGGDSSTIGRVALRIAARKGVAAQEAALQRESLLLAGVKGDYSGAPQKRRAPRLVVGKMLDFRSMSRAWVAAGKPEAWQRWIKDFPLYTEAKKLSRIVR